VHRKIEKPWGHEVIWAETDNYIAKLIVIEAGQRLSKQYHEEKTETVYVIEGTLVNYDENDVASMFQVGQSFHVEPGQIHRFGATDYTGVKVIEVSTNHLDDVIRISDDYGR
jgi:mannose-6-phosphate isomerase